MTLKGLECIYMTKTAYDDIVCGSEDFKATSGRFQVHIYTSGRLDFLRYTVQMFDLVCYTFLFFF